MVIYTCTLTHDTTQTYHNIVYQATIYIISHCTYSILSSKLIYYVFSKIFLPISFGVSQYLPILKLIMDSFHISTETSQLVSAYNYYKDYNMQHTKLFPT